MLMHSAVNQTIGIVPDADPNAKNPFALSASLPYLLTVGFLWVIAAYFLARMPKAEQLHTIAITRDLRSNATVA
jgi:hypothetical protein